MNNAVKYRGTWLAKTSTAYELWEAAKKDPEAQKKLDKHMKEVEQNYLKLHGPMPEHLNDYKIGNDRQN